MDIAVAVPAPESGARRVEVKKSVNKDWPPIVFKYETSINANEIKKRFPGFNPYEDPQANAAAIDLAFRGVRKIETMLRDAIEELCSQVLTTGTITATDENGATVAGPINFFPLDATGTLASGDLIVTTGTAWATDGSTGAPVSDLQSLASNMRARGYSPRRAIFGSSAWQRFLANADVQTTGDLRRINLVDINPQPNETSATKLGTYALNDDVLDFYTYAGVYKAPNGGASTPYLATDKVVLMADEPGGLELTFGSIARFEQAVDTRALPLLPSQMSFAQGGFGMSLYAYFTPDAQNLVICAGTRVLPIPAAIDSFACIDVAP